MASKNTTSHVWAGVSVRGLDECWPWQRGRNKRGYGRVSFDGVNCLAHRLIWILTFGEIEDDLFVLHSCDNPPCCNPKHLFLGTHLDNARDKISKGRLRVPLGEDHVHSKLTDDLVTEVRRLCDEGCLSQRSIAKRLGVSQSLVSLVRTGKAWRHVR